MLLNIDDDFSFLDKSQQVPMVVIDQITTAQPFLVNNIGKTIRI